MRGHLVNGPATLRRMTAVTGRPLKVGVQLPEVEREVRWPELLDMARAIDDSGFDWIWVGEHLLYRWEDRPAARPVGGMDAARGPRRRRRPRIELGPLVACTNFHNPALLAKQAATIDEIAGGRFVLGLGAGWNETEFRASASRTTIGSTASRRRSRSSGRCSARARSTSTGVLPGPRLRAPAASPRPADRR